MKEATSSSANDPRQPSTAKPYVPPTLSPQDLPVDYAGFIAVIFGVLGVTLRNLALKDRCDSDDKALPWLLLASSFGRSRMFSEDRGINVALGMWVAFIYKLCSWLAIIFCAQSLANMKNFENDFKQISMAFMFGIMGLVTNYLGPARPSNKKG